MDRLLVRHRDSQAGFTLLELIIVVGLIAVIMAILTLGVRQASNSFQLRRAATVVTSELRRAQTSAVGEGNPYAVEFALSSPYGITVYKQVSGSWTVVPRPTSGPENWPSTVSIQSSGSTVPNCTGSPGNTANLCVIFRSLGYADSGGVVQLQNLSGTIASINVTAATGRVSITP